MAKENRSFSPSDIPRRKDDYHGTCRATRIQPDIASKRVQSVNMVLTFEECLKLSTALQSGILSLNRYKRTRGCIGREIGMCVSLMTANNQINVTEIKVVAPDEPAGRNDTDCVETQELD